MIKLKLTEKELEEIISDVMEKYQIMESFPPRGVFGEMLNRNIVTDGLITTYSPNDTINVLNNCKLKFYDVRARRLLHSDDNKTIYNIVLYFDKGLHNIGIEYFNNILNLLDVCGWYPSIIYRDGNKIEHISNETYTVLKENENPFDMICEAKFDIMIDNNDLPDKLYHITKKKNLEDIRNRGLVPNIEDKASYYPERIYLFDKSIIDNCYSVAEHLYNLNRDGDKEFVLLQVYVSRLRSLADFYYDSNADLKGFYTLRPINPYSIARIIDINID